MTQTVIRGNKPYYTVNELRSMWKIALDPLLSAILNCYPEKMRQGGRVMLSASEANRVEKYIKNNVRYG